MNSISMENLVSFVHRSLRLQVATKTYTENSSTPPSVGTLAVTNTVELIVSKLLGNIVSEINDTGTHRSINLSQKQPNPDYREIPKSSVIRLLWNVLRVQNLVAKTPNFA